MYRDEYYNSDSPAKGLAECIIGKHRNGPIGKVFLTWMGQFTKFDNALCSRIHVDGRLRQIVRKTNRISYFISHALQKSFE